MSRVPWAANGSTTNPCCDDFELAIRYDWRGTGQWDLDTKTEAFGESVGWICGGSGTYLKWLQGGMLCQEDGTCDDTSQNGFERVDVLVNTAKADGLWTSSYNIECYAGWYHGSPGAHPNGEGGATLEVTYRGKTQTLIISPGSQTGDEGDQCSSTPVATVTVYAEKQKDGSYFEIS